MSSTISILPRLRQQTIVRAIASCDEHDFGTPAGRSRIVSNVTRALVTFEQRLRVPGVPPLSAKGIEAMVRVAMADMLATSCA
jgi:hypothetical protein